MPLPRVISLNSSANAGAFSLSLFSIAMLLAFPAVSQAADTIDAPVKTLEQAVEVYTDLDIHVTNPVPQQNYGLYLSNGSKTHIVNGNITVETTGTNVYGGVYVDRNSTLTADKLNVKTTGITGIKTTDNATVNLGTGSSVQTSGAGVDGILLMGKNVDVKANQLNVSADGSYAMNINSGTKSVDLGKNSVLKSSATGYATLWLVSEQATFKADALTVIAEGAGGQSMAIDQRYGVAEITDSQIISKHGAGIVLAKAYAAASTRPLMTLTGSSVSAGSQYAVSSQGLGVKLILNQVDLSISAGGDAGYGIWALAGGEVAATDVNIQAKTSGTSGAVSQNGATLSLQGNTVIELADPTIGQAIRAQGASSGNSGYFATVTGDGKMRLIGNIDSRDDAKIDLNMTSGSYWSGAGRTALDTGAKNDIAMTGSVWDMTADSTLSSLNLNNSRVNFATQAGAPGARLDVKDLSGSGLFILRSDLVSGTTDKLVVSNSSQGSHRLTILNQGSNATTGDELLTVVETADGAADFALTNNVELGAYEYGLRRDVNDQNNWHLYSTGKKSSTANAALSFINIGYLLDRAETQTLMQRMGDLRSNNSDGDLWLRGFSGKIEYNDTPELAGFDMNYHGMQAGVDKRFSRANSDVYVGALLGMTNSDQDYNQGGGSVKGRHAGLYATYINQSGFYLDTVAKYTYMVNRFDVTDTSGAAVHARASTNGYTLSTEAGQRFHFDQSNNGLYVEPQVQLTFAYQGGADFVASNGLATRIDSYRSMQGRVGTLLGYEVNKGRTPSNIYFKTGYVREFGGDIDYRLNDITNQHRIKSNAWENGVGVNVEINRKHQLTLEMSNSTGDKFKQNQLNAGYRFSF